jgi:hypothetical protein
MRIKFQLQTTIGGTRWEFDGHALTIEDAIKDARQMALEFVGVRWFMGVNVFDMDNDGAFVATVTLARRKRKSTTNKGGSVQQTSGIPQQGDGPTRSRPAFVSWLAGGQQNFPHDPILDAARERVLRAAGLIKTRRIPKAVAA